MTKPKKHYLEKKIEGLDQKYSKIPDQYSELKNIYRGKDKECNKNKKLHKLKDRYEAAETYLQGLDKQNTTPEQRKYLVDLARTFVEYDLKLDKKRKEPEYKEAVRKKRIDHLGKTLEAMALDETPVKEPSTAYKTLDSYVQQPKTVTPTQPKIVIPPTLQPSQASAQSHGLAARMYNATTKACNATGSAIKKYWKYGVTFVAGAAVGSLITYYCMTKPVVKPAPPAPPKQEQVIKKQEPKKPIIKKQTPPVIQEEKKIPEATEIKKPSIEERLNSIDFKYGSLPISSVEKHMIDHKVQKALGLNLKTYTVREGKLKDCNYSPKDIYPALLEVLESEDVKYMHIRMSSKGLVPAMQVEFSSNPEEKVSETDMKKHSSNYGFLTNMSVVNFDGKAADKASCKGYDVKVKLEGDAKEKALEALRLIHWHLSHTNDSKSFHSYWNLRDKNTPRIKGHMIYSDKDTDERFKLRGIAFVSDDTMIEVMDGDDSIKIGQEEKQPSP